MAACSSEIAKFFKSNLGLSRIIDLIEAELSWLGSLSLRTTLLLRDLSQTSISLLFKAIQYTTTAAGLLRVQL